MGGRAIKYLVDLTKANLRNGLRSFRNAPGIDEVWKSTMSNIFNLTKRCGREGLLIPH